jgi:hypothetical protein
MVNYHYIEGDNYNIIRVENYKHLHLLGSRFFLGYCPTWRVNEKVSLGFNLNFGLDILFKTNSQLRWRPMNWDLGFVIKIK